MSSTPTAARPVSDNSGHWYYPDGTPAYTVIAKSTGLPRPTTLRDARLLGLLPSTTNILRCLDKPALTNWLIENACLAVLTTPRLHSEGLDAFVHRVLHEEKVQNQESDKARDLGTDIHNAMEALLKGERIHEDLVPWVDPAYQFVRSKGPNIVALERVLVGDGYAGRCDFIGDCGEHEWILDWKTTKRLPERGSWTEHKWQLASYAWARAEEMGREKISKPIVTGNVYISTTDCGKFAYYENGNWPLDYDQGFAPLAQVWRHLNNYKA